MDLTYISKLTGKKYMLNSTIDKKLFEKELKDYNITLNEYVEKFFKNVAHKKHLNKTLKEDEEYFIKKIKFSYETYEKIIVNKKWKCELCKNFYAASFPSFCSHIKRHHLISLYDYFIKSGYTEIKSKQKNCAWCGKEAFYIINYDYKNKTFQKIYPRYFCESDECKNKICLEFFKKPYKECVKEFEHIGGKTEFLCKAYKTTPEGLKKIGKSKAAKNQRNRKYRLC